jgi:hypothetical protein
LDFQIDYQTFLRLTGEKLGPSKSETYLIEPEGVQLWKDGVNTSEIAKRRGGGHTDAWFLQMAEEARLPFPTTASSLIAWQKKNTEFELPSWLLRAAGAESSGSAIAELDLADGECRAQQDGAALRIAALKTSGGSARNWYPIEVEWNHLLALHAAIRSLREQISLAIRSKQKKPQRFDAMAEEIERALEVLTKRSGRDSTPAEVMGHLRRLAGNPGSCITEPTLTGGVMWCRADGGVEKLDMKLLKNRLARRRRREA